MEKGTILRQIEQMQSSWAGVNITSNIANVLYTMLNIMHRIAKQLSEEQLLEKVEAQEPTPPVTLKMLEAMQSNSERQSKLIEALRHDVNGLIAHSWTPAEAAALTASLSEADKRTLAESGQ